MEKIMYRVWHKKNPDFWNCSTELNVADFVCVGFVQAKDLDEAWRLTNSIDEPWWENEGAELSTNLEGARSLAVGDILQNMKTNECWAVDRIGWKKVPIDKGRKTIDLTAAKINKLYESIPEEHHEALFELSDLLDRIDELEPKEALRIYASIKKKLEQWT